MTSSRDQDRRHRLWDPYAMAATPQAEQLASAALDAQFSSRCGRLEGQGRKARRSGERERRTVEAIILDVLAHDLTDRDDQDLTVRLGNDWLSGDPFAPTALNAGVRDRLVDLEAAGWLTIEKGNNHGMGRLTTLRPSRRLLDAAKALGVGLKGIARPAPEHGEIDLRGRKRTDAAAADPDTRALVRFVETELTSRLREQVARLNGFFDSLQLGQADVEGLPPIDLSRRRVKRTFLNSSFERGGRLGGPAFWLNLKKDRRRSQLRIEGEPVAEVDLVAALPAIAYGIEGHTLWDDPYDLPGFEDVGRGPLKTAMVIFMWTAFKRQHGRLPADVRADIPARHTYADVFEAICRRNPTIAHRLGIKEPIGAELMWHESEIIIDAVFRAEAAGIPCLPIHDALVVPASRAEAAVDVLSDAFAARFKRSAMITCSVYGEDGQRVE